MAIPWCSKYFAYTFLLLMYSSSSLQRKHFTSYNVKVTSLLPSDFCMRNHSSKVHKRDSTSEVVHKYGPCINQKDYEMTRTGNEAESMLIQDQNRVNWMQAQTRFWKQKYSAGDDKLKEMKSRVQLQSAKAIGTGNYVVSVGIGTPVKEFLLILDTGSDMTWTKCKACVGSCHKLPPHIFDPKKSSSYKNVSCSSSHCNLVLDMEGGKKGCSSSTCVYIIEYNDQTFTVGLVATEKLTISSSDVFNGFLFGCGQINIGRLGRVSGLLGLGPGQLSFPIQTAKKYNKLFSYCIPSTSSSTGHLTFGSVELPDGVMFTPLSVDLNDLPFYVVEITGVSVDNRNLSIDAPMFSTSGAIIDSGTVISRLPPTVYYELSWKFDELMGNYPLTNGTSILDTCYDMSDEYSIVIPKISIFIKGGVELEIKPSGILMEVGGVEKMCLAFAPNDHDSDFSILGNSQLKTYEVVHDLSLQRIGFAPSGCT